MPEGSLKTVLTFIWTAVLSFLAFPVTVAGYLLDKRMSVDVKTTNNNDTKIDNGQEQEFTEAIKSSWNVIWTSNGKEKRKAYAIEFFITFFTKHPEALPYFNAFKHVTEITSLRANPRFAAHGLNVLRAVDSYVEYMDDQEMLTNLLSNMLRTHRARGVGASQIRWLIDTMHAVLDLVMGEGKTPPNWKVAWTDLFEKIASIADNLSD